MAAYDLLLNMVKSYFQQLGYDEDYIDDYFSPAVFREVLAIKLVNANVVIRNKRDKTSHQTHIAIVGEATEIFGGMNKYRELTTSDCLMVPIAISVDNLNELKNNSKEIINRQAILMEKGFVSVGKRTQNQIQLSKKMSLNSDCFNQLRNCLFENDLIIFMKYRKKLLQHSY